ncbi:hypothetical protein AAKU55_003742 [Oxalobacteraceae bacterium GrIS 1.11]
MGRPVRKTAAVVDYYKVQHKHDKLGFGHSNKVITVKLKTHPGIAGRARAAPPIAAWPYAGMHGNVSYHDDINGSANWMDGSADTVWLPFKLLDVLSPNTWQGWSQLVTGKDNDAEAVQHFQQISTTLRAALSSHVITECVGEAAAAIYMLSHWPGYKMIWGFHLHSGTGIDQIWRKDCGLGNFEYVIVEAKGPGAHLVSSNFLPSGYDQMEEGWVLNHLRSMEQNNHLAGQEIVAKLGLTFALAHQNYGGASKSYYGLAGQSKPGKLFGIVLTAHWLSDGRLSCKYSKAKQYL